MPENAEVTAVAGENTEPVTEFKAPASQADLDRIIQDRVARERAKFADYDDVKARAAKLSEIEEANKTETEKVAERLAIAEKRAAELEVKSLRSDVALAKGVPAALLTGSTQEELEAAADALIEFRGEVKPAAPSSPALSRVNNQNSAGTSDGQFVRELFGS